MKTILRHVQIALAGEGKDGRVISADMLRNIASNFNGNNYPQILKNKPGKSINNEVIGCVTHVYLAESTLGLALYGCLEFTEYYDMATLKNTLDNRVYVAIEVMPVQPGYESLYRIWFTDSKFMEQQQPVNFRKCKCIGREEQAQKTLEPETDTLFKKKYDDVNSGFVGTVESTDSKGKEPVITFDNEGQDIGGGILRYGHYKNGALMGYVVVKVTEFGGDGCHQESLDILEKFIQHQRRQ
ncbi:hypothetical protein KY035_003198 [Salmonella enterica subsp. enterica serovar Sandiego]|nr:hypothetical protein [Salmonella enterica subsp. enterica serovar Sandiego]